MATGHYARSIYNPEKDLYELHRGKDRSKDQGYFLYRLNQDQLSKVKFPVGTMDKTEVRKIAADLNLPTAEKEESQEICFVEDNDYIRFLNEHYPAAITPGPIYSMKGEKLGEHKGLINYTIGQRKKLGISYSEPLYVINIDLDRNALVVGSDEDLFRTELEIEDLNWISGKQPSNERVYCKIRYRHNEAPAFVTVEKNLARVRFDEPQRALTPGQSAVFYSYPDGDVVLGGGVIK
jgi:tRNA-uridine 2-sulfurtransferase